MIRHFVFVRFKAGVDRAERTAIFSQLADLRKTLPGMVSAGFGPNVSPEPLTQGFNDAFVADFIDAAARDVYLADPAHKAAGSRLIAALEGAYDGIMVFDLDVG